MNVNQVHAKLRAKRARFGVTGPDKGECTAIPHYVQRLLKIPIVYGNAVDIYRNAPSSQYVKFKSKFRARKGDIVIWGQNARVRTTRFGHVAWFEGRVRPGVFSSIDQNWPTGGRPQRILHTYDGVIGFIRPKAYTRTGFSVPKLTRVNRIFKKYRSRNVTKGEFRALKRLTDSKIIKRLTRR